MFGLSDGIQKAESLAQHALALWLSYFVMTSPTYLYGWRGIWDRHNNMISNSFQEESYLRRAPHKNRPNADKPIEHACTQRKRGTLLSRGDAQRRSAARDAVREMGGAPRNPAPRNHSFWRRLSNHQAATPQMGTWQAEFSPRTKRYRRVPTALRSTSPFSDAGPVRKNCTISQFL